MNRLHRVTSIATAVGLLVVPALAVQAAGVDGVHWADAWKIAGGAERSTSLDAPPLLGGVAPGQWINRDIQTKSAGASAKDNVPGIYCSPVATVLHVTEPARFPACNQPFFIEEGRLATLSSGAQHTG